MAHDLVPRLGQKFAAPTTLDASTLSLYPPDLQFKQNLISSSHIFIRDPPRNWRLPTGAESFFLSCFPGESINTLTANLTISPRNEPIYVERSTSVVPRSHLPAVKMVKKRRSLQSIFTSSFLNAHSPTSPELDSSYSISTHTSRMRSYSTSYPHADQLEKSQSFSSTTSPRASPPPDFLIDDDPFANLSAAPSSSRPVSTVTPAAPITIPPKPRSPLTPTSPETKPIVSPNQKPPMPVGVSRALSGRARPAYQKPAFAPRPSLPSLHTLARMNVVFTKKVRKGRVGAGLPFEPWDNIDDEQSSADSSTTSLVPSSPAIPLGSSNPSDFVADLDFLDLSDEEDGDLDDTGHFADSSTNDITSRFTPNTDISMDDQSPPPLSRTASSDISTLTRSASLISNSSEGSFDIPQWPSYHGNGMSSAESDSDILGSPPDDYFTFPISRYSSDVFATLYDLDSHADDTLFSHINVLGGPDLIHEPGTSAGTIRPSMESKPSDLSSELLVQGDNYAHNYDEVVDGGGWEGHQGNGNSYPVHNGGSGQGYGESGGRANGSSGSGGGGGRFNGSGRRGFGGGGDDEDKRDKRRINYPSFSAHSDSDASTSDETEEDSVDDSPNINVQPTVGISRSTSLSDDDVPLAQRIPTALQAQRTIRRQVREERDQRRKERALRAEQSSSLRAQQSISHPVGAAGPSSKPMMTSSQEAALHASKSIKRPQARASSTAEMKPFAAEDLSRRLESIEVAESSLSRRVTSTSGTSRDVAKRSKSVGRGLRDPGSAQISSPPQSPPPEPARSLHHARSFHRSEGRKLEDHYSVPMPTGTEQKLGRSTTRVRPKEGSMGSYETGRRPSTAPTSPTENGQKVPSRRSGEESRKISKEPKSARGSLELEKPPRTSIQRPPVPPLPSMEAMLQANNRVPLTQQRVFICDMQRFNMVEIGPSTNAGDVIDMVEAQGSLKGWVGSGGWMVWEIAQDFGMERPIRSFELLADIQASWNKDKMLNTFMIKLTPLEKILSRSAMPSASPTYAGYVEWESKRGKWNKRWLQLREHGLWLSKRANSKDDVLVCSLSNFDAYYITRVYKSPRPFVFAVKSTDNLSFFENTADYLQIFSCTEQEGKIWMEKILLARSYVLYQERHILFNPKSANMNAAGGASTLSRAGTRKGSRPTQPLVSVSPPFAANTQHSNGVFEPGSLLHSQP